MCVTFIFFTFITAVDLYAYETKSELDINKYVFAEEQAESKEMRKIDYFGHVIFLQPVGYLKDNAESKLFLERAKISHDENEQYSSMNNQNQHGPKIRLTF